MDSMSVGLIIALVALLTLFLSGYIFWVQYRNKRALIGRKLATILTPAGERHDKLLKVRGNQLWDKVEGGDVPYMVRPDKSYDVWWPFGKPRLLQVSIKSYLYAEGNPEPIDPFNKPPVLTSEVLANLQNINFSKAMVGRSEEIVEKEGPGKVSIPLYLYIIVGVAVTASLGAVFMVFAGGD